MKQALYKLYARLERLPVIGAAFRKVSYPIQLILYVLVNHESRCGWQRRIDLAMSCPDNVYLPRVADAGKVQRGCVTMHNGILVSRGSYYGVGMHLLLQKNRGVHEPQEERVFMEVLNLMPQNAVMLELGSYWGFYSMWFHQKVSGPVCYLVEPSARNIEAGRENFRINRMNGKFFQAFVGSRSQKSDDVPVIGVDDFIDEHQIGHIHILHSDIQGAECEMLNGARRAFSSGMIDYVFISTHADDLHAKCREFLLEHDFIILADVDLTESYSEDGVIVGRRKELAGLMPLALSKRTNQATCPESRGQGRQAG